MFTIRCTKKLLVRLGASRTTAAPQEPGAPTTRLGDWHANALYLAGAEELVLFVNDRSLLPVIVPARPRDLIVARFVEAVGATLRRLGIPESVVVAELAEMADARLGPTKSRQILGSMNDFDRMFDEELARSRLLVDAGLRLADAPCGPLSMRRPRDIAVELLSAGE